MAKGKQGTKGQKQILEENKGTLRFYTLMAGGALALYTAIILLFYWDQFSFKYLMIVLFSVSCYGVGLSIMRYMAKPSFSETGALIDGGTDLNMESGFAENLKDLVIVTAVCQCMSLISNYFWILWLFVPGRACYIIFVNIISPWLFQPSLEPEVDEKKQRKLDRRMKRMQH